MAGTLNRVELIGHLGADPEARYTPNGTPVANFRVATNYSYRTAEGEERTETEWTPIVAWRGLAEACNNYLHKGSKVFVAGRLKTRSWEDEGGQTHYRTEVQADSVIFLDGRQAPNGAGVMEEELPADLGQAEAEPEAEAVAETPRRRRQ
jgi:single-strand DNA-binding protein